MRLNETACQVRSIASRVHGPRDYRPERCVAARALALPVAVLDLMLLAAVAATAVAVAATAVVTVKVIG